MSINNEIQVESEFNKLNISSEINHENCYKPGDKKVWCKECVPRELVEWTSGNHDIDEFIKDTIYNAKFGNKFLEWVPFYRFKNIKQIGEGGFAKVYSATWIDGKAEYYMYNGSWKKREPESMEVALKRLNESNNISNEYLNEVQYVYLTMIIVNFYT